ncbi:uncharacterized protein LOC126807850 [Patella vulgata]|uniref:uncharacterized protein LOC126807850 n=1 Tax=Patella vulgata TaxID=6465 RepID=UPI0024A7F443|nr:uncharacterized protein LOC126807850 [Patella vulgata]
MDDNAISSNPIPVSQQNDPLTKNIFDSMQEMLVKPEDNQPNVKGAGKMQKLFNNSNKPVQWNNMFSRLSQNKELHKFCKTATSNKENKVTNTSSFETVHCNEENLNNTKSSEIVPSETDNSVGSVNKGSKENNTVTFKETKLMFSDDHENQERFKSVTPISNSTDNVSISECTQHSIEDISCNSVPNPDSSENHNTSDEGKSCTETRDEIVLNSEFTEKENVNDLKKSVIDNDCESNDLKRSIINSDYQRNDLKRSIIDSDCEPKDLKRTIIDSECEPNDLKRSVIKSDCESNDLKRSIIDSDCEPSDSKRSIIDSDCESVSDDMPDSWVVKDEIGASHPADMSKDWIGPNSEWEQENEGNNDSDVNQMSMNDLVVLDETSSSDDGMNNISPQRSKTSFNESPPKSEQKLNFSQQNIKSPLELNAICSNKGLDSYDPVDNETLLTKSSLPVPNSRSITAEKSSTSKIDLESKNVSNVSSANLNSSTESSLMITFSPIKDNLENFSELNNSKKICPDSEKSIINSETLKSSSTRSSSKGTFQDVRTSSPINMSIYSDVSDGEPEEHTKVKDDDALSLISSDESFYSEGVDIVGDFFEVDQYENASPVQTRSPETSNAKPSPMSSPESIFSKTSHHSSSEQLEAVDSKVEFIEECGKSILDNNAEVLNMEVSMDFRNKDRRSSLDSLHTIDSLHTVSDCSDNEKDVYDRPVGSSSVPENVLSSSESPSRALKVTTADTVSPTTSKIDINSDLSNSGPKLTKSGVIAGFTTDNVIPNNCKTKNLRPPTPLLDEEIEGDFGAPSVNELMSGRGHEDLVTSSSLDQNVTVRSSTPLLDEINESERTINQSTKQGSMLYSTAQSTKQMDNIVVTHNPFPIETNATGRSSTPVLDEKNELNITNGETNELISPQNPASLTVDTEKNKDKEYSPELQSVDPSILSQSSNVEINIKTCECDIGINNDEKEASDQKFMSQSGAPDEYVTQFKNSTKDQNQVTQRNPSRTNLEHVSLPHISHISSEVKENDSSCSLDVIGPEKNIAASKRCRPIVIDFQNAMVKIKSSSQFNHEGLHQTSDLAATSSSIQEKGLSVSQISYPGLDLQDFPIGNSFSNFSESASKSLLRDDSQQDPNQFNDQDDSLPPLQIDESKNEYLATSQKSDDIIMGFYPNLFGNSRNTCIGRNSEIQEPNKLLENKQETTSSPKSCRKISGTLPKNKNEKNTLPNSKKKTSPNSKKKTSLKIKPGRIEKCPGYSVSHANYEKAMEHYYSQSDQPLYIEKYQSYNNNADARKIDPKLQPILNHTAQVPSLPAVEKKKNYQRGFMVGRMNGAFICLKCKCKFYDRKNFRWHLWHHVHQNADRCPSCNSTDPLSPCETTEGLLNFISNMENKEAFFVTPKQYLRGEVNIAEKQHSPGIAIDSHCSKHLSRESEKKHTNNANTNEKGPQADDTAEKADIGHSLLPIKILNTFSMSTGEFLPTDDSKLTNDHSTNRQEDTSTAYNSNSAGHSAPTNKHNLKDSSTKQTSGYFFKCSVCHKSYLHEKELEDHLFSTHDSTTCFKCVYCGFETFDKLDYASHYAIHINSIGFDCLYPGCNVKSDILDHHLKHLSCHKNWKPSCSRCQLNFDKIHLLSEHYEQNMVSLFACAYCDAKAIERGTFLEHVTKDHALVGLNVRVTNLLVCNISSNVNKLGQNNSPLVQPSTVGNKTNKDHLHSNKPANSDLSFSTFLCQKCSFVCNDKKVFLVHKKIHIAPQDLSETMPFTCPCCPTSFSILTELMFHLEYHDKDLQFSLYQCPEDGFITNDRQKGKMHLSQINHTNVELYQIKTYHHESKIYCCSFCGIKVKEKSIFIQHLSIHGRPGEEEAEVLKEAEDDENFGKKFVSNIHQLNFKTPGSSLVNGGSLSKETQSSIATPKKLFKSPKDCEIEQDINETFTYENNVPYVTKLYNLVIKSTPSYKNCSRALDQKLKILYSHQSGFFVCAICNEKYRVKNLLFNHIIEHLGILYRCYTCGISNKTYDNAICHALKFHQTERNSVVYSESLAEKVHKLADSFPSTIVLNTARTEVSNHVTHQTQEKSFTANRNKTKVFTRLKVMESKHPNSEITTNCTSDLETTPPTHPPAEISDEELRFLAEEDTVKAFSCLIRRGIECSWCKMCGKAFSQTLPGKTQLYHHLLTKHLKYKPHSCFHCPFSAYSAKVLTNHIKTMHVGINIISFTVRNIVEDVIDLIKESGLDIDFSELLEHCDSDSVPGSSVDTSSTISASYSCEMCSATFDCPFKILRHKKTAHSEVVKNTARKSTAPSSSTVRNLLHHKSAQIRLPGYTARKSTSARPLGNTARKSTIQNRRQITPGNTPDPEKKLFKCPKCDYITEKRHRAMLYHFNKKHSFECFIQCYYCQAKFTNKDLWLKHSSLIHSGQEMQFKTLPIEDYFIPWSTSDNHQVEQLTQQNKPEERPQSVESSSLKSLVPHLVCVFCNLKEIKEEYMRYHLYIHLDYKPFKCKLCKKSYSDPFRQKQHICLEHASQQDKAYTETIELYEDKVEELLSDCKRSVQNDLDYIPWNLDDVLNTLSDSFTESKEEDSSDFQTKDTLCSNQDYHDETLQKLQQISPRKILGSYDKEDQPQNHADDVHGQETDKSKIIKFSSKRKTISLSDYTFQNSNSSGPLLKKIKMSPGGVDSLNSSLNKPVAKSKPLNKTKSSSAVSLQSLGSSSSSSSLGIKRSPVEEPSSKSKWKKHKSSNSGEFDNHNIMCYYCSYSSEAVSHVISHTQQQHVGRNWVALLWIDKITGGTYDHEGNIFSNGFDSDVVIEERFLCGLCNFRAKDMVKILEHEDTEHEDIVGSSLVELKTIIACSGSRRHRTAASSNLSKTVNKPDKPKKPHKPQPITEFKKSPGKSKPVSNGMTYNCSVCSVLSTSEYQFRRHLATHSNFCCLVPDLSQNPQLKCWNCSFRATSIENFTRHLTKQVAIIKYECGHCGYRAGSPRAVKIHNRSKHSEKEPNIWEVSDETPSCANNKNLSLIVDLEPHVRLEDFQNMTQTRFEYLLQRRPQKILH